MGLRLLGTFSIYPFLAKILASLCTICIPFLSYIQFFPLDCASCPGDSDIMLILGVLMALSSSRQEKKAKNPIRKL